MVGSRVVHHPLENLTVWKWSCHEAHCCTTGFLFCKVPQIPRFTKPKSSKSVKPKIFLDSLLLWFRPSPRARDMLPKVSVGTQFSLQVLPRKPWSQKPNVTYNEITVIIIYYDERYTVSFETPCQARLRDARATHQEFIPFGLPFYQKSKILHGNLTRLNGTAKTCQNLSQFARNACALVSAKALKTSIASASLR